MLVPPQGCQITMHLSQMPLLEFQHQPHLSGAPAGVCCHHLPLGLLPCPLPGSLSHPH